MVAGRCHYCIGSYGYLSRKCSSIISLLKFKMEFKILFFYGRIYLLNVYTVFMIVTKGIPFNKV